MTSLAAAALRRSDKFGAVLKTLYRLLALFSSTIPGQMAGNSTAIKDDVIKPLIVLRTAKQ